MAIKKAQAHNQAERHYLQRDQGFFKAEVYITRRSSGESLVCKDYSRFRAPWNAPLARWLASREYRLLKRLQDWPHSPHVYPSDSPLVVQMEYLPASLLSHQPREQRAQTYRQLRLALVELHGMGITHNDIRGANIMLRGNTPVFIDFTSACALPKLPGLIKLMQWLRLFDLRHLVKVKRSLDLPLSRRERRLRRRSGGIQQLLNLWKKGLLPYLKHNKHRPHA